MPPRIVHIYLNKMVDGMTVQAHLEIANRSSPGPETKALAARVERALKWAIQDEAGDVVGDPEPVIPIDLGTSRN